MVAVLDGLFCSTIWSGPTLGKWCVYLHHVLEPGKLDLVPENLGPKKQVYLIVDHHLGS